jgi:hypothetical protein
VVTVNGDILWHTRKGLSDDKTRATIFKTVEHALKLCRKKYSPILGIELKNWKASEL